MSLSSIKISISSRTKASFRRFYRVIAAQVLGAVVVYGSILAGDFASDNVEYAAAISIFTGAIISGLDKFRRYEFSDVIEEDADDN